MLPQTPYAKPPAGSAIGTRTWPRRDWPLTYTDLDRVTDEVAAGLAARGVGEGDVVALVLPPGRRVPRRATSRAAKLGAITAGVNDRPRRARARRGARESRDRSS